MSGHLIRIANISAVLADLECETGIDERAHILMTACKSSGGVYPTELGDEPSEFWEILLFGIEAEACSEAGMIDEWARKAKLIALEPV